MKKLFYTLLVAAAGLLTASCMQEHIEAVYDPAFATAQTLGEIGDFVLEADGEAVTTTFNPADFDLPVAATYSLFASNSDDMFGEVKVSANISIDENGIGHISMKQATLNSLVFALGGVADEPFNVYFQLQGAMANDKNNALEPTMLYSNIISAVFTPYSMIIKDVDLYDHVWVIGASASVGSWSFEKVYQYLYDYTKSGNTYTGLIDFGEAGPSGGFKLVGVNNWNDESKNWGSEAQTEEAEQSPIQLVAGGGSKDIKCYSKRYNFFSFDTGTLVLTKKYGFDNVGIVGAFNGWNAADADMKMTYNDKLHRFYIDYEFAEDTELKFTCDDKWELNWGGKDGTTAGGGDNIAVAAGKYRIYLDLNKGEYDLNSSMYGKDEPTGEDEPEPEPEPTYKGWGIIGDFNSWGGDAAMTEVDGVWTGYFNNTENGGFKFRKDADWAENYGGNMVAFGEAFAAVAGGDNISTPAGFYKAVLNLTDADAPTITIYDNATVWSLIGDFNSWGGDVDMTEEDGKWVAKGVTLSGGWKIRKNHDWTENRGGVFVAMGQAFAAEAGGANIDCGEGEFNVVYDPAAETITVEGAVPSNTWSLIGVNGDWGTDIFMTELMPGVWVSPKVEITEPGWKVRFDHDWAENRGGKVSAEGVFAKAVPGGDNIQLTGTFQVVYNANNETIGTLVWGVVGSVASIDGFSWNKDVPMNLGSDGKWYSLPITLAEGDEIKIRKYADWADNFGGAFAEADVPFAAEAGGSNIKAEGTYVVVYDPEAATLTLSTNFWGLIGDFNSWGGDKFMLFDGANFVAYNQSLSGGWKIRKTAGWDVNRGGTFVEKDAFFEAVPGGSNIDVGSLTGFDVVYVPSNEVIFVGDVANMPEEN